MSVPHEAANATPDEQQRIAREFSHAAELELIPDHPELVVFSSQLVHGSVGLNSAELIYRASHITVAQIPTILLSVLPHYASVHHVDIPAQWIADSLHDLAASASLGEVKMLSTGYLAHPEQAAAIAAAKSSIAQLQNCQMIVDPTLGDVEVGFYTDPALGEALRTHLIPLATGLVPNLFELAHLTQTAIATLTSAEGIADVARTLMTPNTQWIVVTGLRLGTDSELSVLLVTAQESVLFTHEWIDHQAKGVGDAYTAMLVSELLAGTTIAEAIPVANTRILEHIRGTQNSN